MFEYKGYTVVRLSNSNVQVQDKRTKKAHTIMAMVGDKGTPYCPCHKPGSCTHQDAVKAFCTMERSAQSAPVFAQA